MKNNYVPHPAELDGVEVDERIMRLAEKIAENTHEVWAAGRISEGWKYGEKLDAEKKTHPMLVPYSELPESEKDYDRRTSLQTIKLILKLGFKII